jgi:hypothetical protein
MSTIDSELNNLREKINELLVQKKEEEEKKKADEEQNKINNFNIELDLPIISREYLQKRKSEKDEEKRINKIIECIKRIYKDVITFAETNTSSKYDYRIPINNNSQTINKIKHDLTMYNYPYGKPNTVPYTIPVDEFYTTNKIEIIAGLKKLFPECDIKYTVIAKKYSNYYDLQIPHNPSILYDNQYYKVQFQPNININIIEECIVIDWY